jgi:hypothetical protein
MIEKKSQKIEKTKIQHLLEVNQENFANQMIGRVPGLEIEDIFFFNKNIHLILSNIDFEKPYNVISGLFCIEDDFQWIKDALEVELEKNKLEQEKNLPLKKYLQETIQNMIESLQKILNNEKIGYLFSLIVNKYIAELLKISYEGGLEISFDVSASGPDLDGAGSLSQLIAYVPSVKDVRFPRKDPFLDKNGEMFRINNVSIEKLDSDHKWIRVEDIPEYKNIDPELVSPKTIRYLLSFDKFFFYQNGFPVSEISFKERIFFYNFVLKKNYFQIYQIFACYEKLNQSVDFFRTFFATQHTNDDIGQKIIDIGEQLPSETAEKIFTQYAKIIDQAEKIQNHIKDSLVTIEDIDQSLKEKLPYQLYNALLLRAKDILLGAHMIISSDDKEKLDIDNVCNALLGITKMLEIINDIKEQKDFKFIKTFETEQNHKYIITDPKTNYQYELKIFLRPYAEKNAQARANFELSFDTDFPDPVLKKSFYNEIISHTQGKVTTGATLRIGIDRENYDGIDHVSLDIGRSEHSDDALTRTGDILGNLLAYSSLGGHHTTEPFSPEFGKEQVFAELVQVLSKSLMNQK